MRRRVAAANNRNRWYKRDRDTQSGLVFLSTYVSDRTVGGYSPDLAGYHGHAVWDTVQSQSPPPWTSFVNDVVPREGALWFPSDTLQSKAEFSGRHAVGLTTDFSVALWLIAVAGGTRPILSVRGDDTSYGWCLEAVPSSRLSLRAASSGSSSLSTTGNFEYAAGSDTRWRHAAVVVTGGTAKWYRDGTLRKVEPWAGGSASGSGRLVMGAERFQGGYNYGSSSETARRRFNGIRVYNRPLLDVEVRQLFARGPNNEGDRWFAGVARPPKLALNYPVVLPPYEFVCSVGEFVELELQASGSPTLWAATGLPAGLSLDTDTGTISGVPSADGETDVVVVASNEDGDSDPRIIRIVVVGAASMLLLGVS